MAYVPPTAEDLKAYFPEFAAVDDSTVDSALAEAARNVDESWTEADFATARMYFAAHRLVSRGLGAGTEGKITGLVLSGLSSIKIGSLGVGFKSRNSSSGIKYSSPMSTTSYGVYYLQLLKLNKPTVVVADGST